MEIKGTKRELEDLFKSKKKKRLFPKLNIKPFKILNQKQKNILFFSMLISAMIILVLLSLMAFLYYSNNYITISQCQLRETMAYRSGLMQQDLPRWLLFIRAYEKQVGLIIMAIAISWIIHGVGFKIIN